MGEDKRKPSQKPLMQRPWFWPVVYSGMALMIVAVIFSFNELYESQQEKDLTEETPSQQTIIPTSTKLEVLKYPFKEQYSNEATILQEYQQSSYNASPFHSHDVA